MSDSDSDSVFDFGSDFELDTESSEIIDRYREEFEEFEEGISPIITKIFEKIFYGGDGSFGRINISVKDDETIQVELNQIECTDGSDNSNDCYNKILKTEFNPDAYGVKISDDMNKRIFNVGMKHLIITNVDHIVRSKKLYYILKYKFIEYESYFNVIPIELISSIIEHFETDKDMGSLMKILPRKIENYLFVNLIKFKYGKTGETILKVYYDMPLVHTYITLSILYSHLVKMNIHGEHGEDDKSGYDKIINSKIISEYSKEPSLIRPILIKYRIFDHYPYLYNLIKRKVIDDVVFDDLYRLKEYQDYFVSGTLSDDYSFNYDRDTVLFNPILYSSDVLRDIMSNINFKFRLTIKENYLYDIFNLLYRIYQLDKIFFDEIVKKLIDIHYDAIDQIVSNLPSNRIIVEKYLELKMILERYLD